MLSDALLRIMYHLIYGKVDPEQVHFSWNIRRDSKDFNPLYLFKNAIESPDLYNAISNMLAQDHFTIALRDALKHYRRIASEGNLAIIPEGPTIEPQMRDERIIEIRKHLIKTGDFIKNYPDSLKNHTNDPDVYDTLLVKAVKKYQKRHGFIDDGKIGKKTIGALNVPIEDRIKQIIVNLERGRWIFRNMEEEYILVNIPAYQAVFVRNGEVIWRSRTQVGTEERQTPVFKAELKYLEFNPTWTVPPTILKEDVLPEIKKDSSFLNRKKMALLNSKGDTVLPANVLWDSVTYNNFPYIISQKPGDYNALGSIKFMFPNRYRVFIHDTPSKGLFEKEKRTFSSGYIRVEKPLKLATLVLNDTLNWNSKNIHNIISKKKTKVVHLEKTVPVLIVYLTVFPSNENDKTINFRDDIYQWDDITYNHLKKPFQKRKQHQ